MLRSFIFGLRIVDSIARALKNLPCQFSCYLVAKSPVSESRLKHIDVKYLAIRIQKDNKVIIALVGIELIVDPLTKDMLSKGFRDHMECMGVGPIMQ